MLQIHRISWSPTIPEQDLDNDEEKGGGGCDMTDTFTVIGSVCKKLGVSLRGVLSGLQ